MTHADYAMYGAAIVTGSACGICAERLSTTIVMTLVIVVPWLYALWLAGA